MDMQRFIADVQTSLRYSQITVHMVFYGTSPDGYDEVEYLKELQRKIGLMQYKDDDCQNRDLGVQKYRPNAEDIIRQVEAICPHAQLRQNRTHQQDLEYWKQLRKEMEKTAKGAGSLPSGPSREEQVLEALLIRDAGEFVLKTEELMTYAERIDGDKLAAVAQYLDAYESGFIPEEYQNYKKNLEKLKREAERIAGYVRNGQYPDAERLANDVLLEMIRRKAGDFMRYVNDKLLEYWGGTSFSLYEGLARCFNAYLADLGIRTYNETKIGEYLSDTDESIYVQEGIAASDPKCWNRIYSVDRPFYYLEYQMYNGRKNRKSWMGEITIYT